MSMLEGGEGFISRLSADFLRRNRKSPSEKTFGGDSMRWMEVRPPSQQEQGEKASEKEEGLGRKMNWAGNRNALRKESIVLGISTWSSIIVVSFVLVMARRTAVYEGSPKPQPSPRPFKCHKHQNCRGGRVSHGVHSWWACRKNFHPWP